MRSNTMTDALTGLPELPIKVSKPLSRREVKVNEYSTIHIPARDSLRKLSTGLTVIAILTFNTIPHSICQSYIEPPFILMCLIVFGLPHGAIDHILYYQVYKEARPMTALEVAGSMSPEATFFESFGNEKNSLSISRRLKIGLFYFNYFAIMTGWMIGWVEFPLVSFWAFLATSAYHFGEGDLNYLRHSILISPTIMYFSRGFFLVGSIASAKPEITLPIIASMTGLKDASSLIPQANALRISCVAQSIILIGLHILAYKNNFLGLSEKQALTNCRQWLQELGKTTLFVILFNAVNPLVAFAIYFAFWHSLGSIVDEILYLKSRCNDLFMKSKQLSHQRDSSEQNTIYVHDLFVFYRAAAPYTLLAVVGMALFFILDPTQAYDGSQETLWSKITEIKLWSIYLVSISVITGPHMWVMKLVAAYWFPRGHDYSHAEKYDIDPLGLESWAKDWIVGGGWWWGSRKIKQG
ncbi:hypothetical protein BCR33DRAFT_716293 [Rhizoclosmatium globosum]|uniref:Beta-carotene 15,15'-dioxygenase n=1 Tax=Rhizoclosmatium globosum TaxID=329046 RepID=A0A1Y2CFE3_9FUNG|nr:hypothetical protein BCR33DRAFT_716293 [Rhizoclosmatium globosum]|eukprot:ORY45646.1 hypothetical protein BCR33DRAFT_716293 [Rhizoclosmatium globosum]